MQDLYPKCSYKKIKKLSAFAKWCPYVVRIHIKWLTKRFYTDPVYGRGYANTCTDTDDKNIPKIINLFHFNPDMDMHIEIAYFLAFF